MPLCCSRSSRTPARRREVRAALRGRPTPHQRACRPGAAVEGRPAMPDPVRGHRLFADGVTRTVRLDTPGKRYAVGPDGEAVRTAGAAARGALRPAACRHGGEALGARVL